MASKAMEEEFQAELDEAPYIGKLQGMCRWTARWPTGPSQLSDFMYIGNEDDATDLKLLRNLNITHVLNCASGYTSTDQEFYGDIKYMGFPAEDEDDYDMLQHFDSAYDFIEDARLAKGKVFVHCLMGVNRSGLIAVSYLMLHKNQGPISVVKDARKSRGMLLTNEGFQRQVVRFARERGLLFLDQKLL